MQKIVDSLARDLRVVGLGLSGSYATDEMDEFSDLDLVVAIAPSAYEEVFKERFELIESLSGHVASFVGEHVGEPRLIISLFLPNAIHVDFKFVSLDDAAHRVDEVCVVWERGELLSSALAVMPPSYPSPDVQWIEDRFWIWVHYAVGKIARGEYFEALEFLSFLRTTVIAPLALFRAGYKPSGVRRVECYIPSFVDELKQTVASADRISLVNALTKIIEIYRALRTAHKVTLSASEPIALKYFNNHLRPE